MRDCLYRKCCNVKRERLCLFITHTLSPLKCVNSRRRVRGFFRLVSTFHHRYRRPFFSVNDVLSFRNDKKRPQVKYIFQDPNLPASNYIHYSSSWHNCDDDHYIWSLYPHLTITIRDGIP